ncbi:uncharacterized protein LOC134532361 [Bacillus rossius redtenbacheri]|uniref:uncharacterized protein LOC134532361 n=1 Tax=Bacillus rossius redtenbacheri TaxID=93214 RepID=UPI002FDEBAF2
MTSKGVALLFIFSTISLQMLYVLAEMNEPTRFAEHNSLDLPKAPSSVLDKGMEVLLTACDFVERYKIGYLLNGFFALKEFRKKLSKSGSKKEKPCSNCQKTVASRNEKSAATSEDLKDKLYSFISAGFTTQEGIALITMLGASVCEIAKSYRDEEVE